MAIKRRTFGTGRGQGYLNLVPMDSLIHSLNAKGIQTTGTLYAKGKKVNYPPERKDIISVMRGKGFRKDFGTIPTPPKKGAIRDIARKVHEGVDWAIQWEKEHLPKQKEWVKKEFAQAKQLAKKGIDFIKEEAKHIKDAKEKRQHQKEVDMVDVRHELDTNDDGVQDISINELKEVNKQIHKDLQKIDLDVNGIPDHIEDNFHIDTEFKEHKKGAGFPLPTYTFTSETEAEPEQSVTGFANPLYTFSNKPVKEEPVPSTGAVEPEKGKSLGINFPFPTVKPKEQVGVQEKKAKHETLTDKYGEEHQRKKTFLENQYEKGRIYFQKKQLEKDFIRSMPDAELKEKAIRYGTGFFNTGNKFEKELIRRTKERLKVDNDIKMAKAEQNAKIKALEEKVKAKAEGKKTGSGFAGIDLGFINPLSTLNPKKVKK